jgi:hypothetical protein
MTPEQLEAELEAMRAQLDQHERDIKWLEEKVNELS